MDHSTNTPLEILRERYMRHLATPVSFGERKGTVAGKQTRRGMRAGAQWAELCQPAWSAFTQAWQHTPDRVFVWSDHHLGHANIIGYTNRPFGGADHMDQSLLYNAQQAIQADDWLLFVGDLAMWKDPEAVHAWVSQCPGRKMLVLGNHDLRGGDRPQSAQDWQTLGFEAVADCAYLPSAHGIPELWITHYPMYRADIPSEVVNLHGHTHTDLLAGPYANACVEHIDYRPQPLRDWMMRHPSGV